MSKFTGIKMRDDRVLLKRRTEFDNPDKVGSIYITDNINIRESKICEVLKIGPGNSNGRGRFINTSVMPGSLVYCTRYGKEIVKENEHDYEGDKYVITREAGILAYVQLDEDSNPFNIIPRMDRIWVKEIKAEERKSDSGLILLSGDPKKKVNSIFKVINVGPGRLDLDSLTTIPMEVKSGDLILANKGAGVQVSWSHSGEVVKYRLISEIEVIGVVSEAISTN